MTMVLGALLCPSPPFGTALGVSTLIVMNRPSVKRLYCPGPTPHVEACVPPAQLGAPIGSGVEGYAESSAL